MSGVCFSPSGCWWRDGSRTEGEPLGSLDVESGVTTVQTTRSRKKPGQVDPAPSGREPVPFTGPIPAGQPRPYVDPANGKIVVPAMGPYVTGKRPWVYQN